MKGQGTVLIEESEPMCTIDVCEESSSNQSSTAGSGAQPYVAGYMTLDYIDNDPIEGGAKALGVTVSFSGTDASVIQSDNWLWAGITAQGPDHVYGGCAAIDWAYSFSLAVGLGYSDPFVHAEVWECHEWGDDCLHNPWAKCVSAWCAFIPGLTINSPTTLTMEWNEDTLDYYAEVGGINHHLVAYYPNETASHYFKIGRVGRQWPFPGTVKFFQFHGAWSLYNIGQTGWYSHLDNPKFIKSGESSWTAVSFAYSTDGPNAYLDNTMVWGGGLYKNVDASYSRKHVTFYPTSNGDTIEPDTELWSGYTLWISTTYGGTTNPSPGIHTYGYGDSVTVHAIPNSGSWFFNYWILDGGAPNYITPITVTMCSDHTLKAHFAYPSGGGPGSGCPMLFVWNGTEYVYNGLLDIHDPEGTDIVINHTLISTPERVRGRYLLRLTEHPQTHSYIDQVKLYAKLEVGITIELPLISAKHSENGNVLPQLLFSDDWKTDTLGADHNNGTSQSINLKFAALSPHLKITEFTLQIEGNNLIVKE